jgi:transcription termination factor Rho
MTATLQESAPPPQETQPGMAVSGIIETGADGAFIRTSGYRRGPADVHVSASQVQ